MNVRKWILFHSCIHYLETPFSDFAQIKGVPRLKLFYSRRVLFFLFANPLKKQRSVLFGLLVCLSVKAVCFCSIWICFDCFFLFFFCRQGTDNLEKKKLRQERRKWKRRRKRQKVKKNFFWTPEFRFQQQMLTEYNCDPSKQWRHTTINRETKWEGRKWQWRKICVRRRWRRRCSS